MLGLVFQLGGTGTATGWRFMFDELHSTPILFGVLVSLLSCKFSCFFSWQFRKFDVKPWQNQERAVGALSWRHEERCYHGLFGEGKD
jgi:hypothetical protein